MAQARPAPSVAGMTNHSVSRPRLPLRAVRHLNPMLIGLLLVACAAAARPPSIPAAREVAMSTSPATTAGAAVIGATTSDLGDGIHVSTTARVSATAITFRTNAWRTHPRGIGHGVVGAYLLDAAGDVVGASRAHAFHTGWPFGWGGTSRAFVWTDPVPADTGSRAASVVIRHARTMSALRRDLDLARRRECSTFAPLDRPCRSGWGRR